MLRHRRFHALLFLSFAAAAFAPGSALADSVTLEPDQDTSLYSESGSLSNGSGIVLFSGATAFGDLRRALLRFDVAAAVPRGAVVTSASLLLWCNQAPLGGADTATFTVHPVSASWGEAGSDAGLPGGAGAPAETGDATWTERFFGQGQPWGSPGADFGATSASASVTGFCELDAPIQMIFASAPQLVADVQAWLDDPAGNFGWALVGDETEGTTARRFLSRDATALRPTLEIEYQVAEVPAVSPWGGAMAAAAFLGLIALALRRTALAGR
jgi:hypothetical protein